MALLRLLKAVWSDKPLSAQAELPLEGQVTGGGGQTNCQDTSSRIHNAGGLLLP